MEALEKQVGGDHYKTPIQPIEYILANKLSFCEGNIVKYITRWRAKGGVEDLKKVIHYAEFLIEHESNEQRKQCSQLHESDQLSFEFILK